MTQPAEEVSIQAYYRYRPIETSLLTREPPVPPYLFRKQTRTRRVGGKLLRLLDRAEVTTPREGAGRGWGHFGTEWTVIAKRLRRVVVGNIKSQWPYAISIISPRPLHFDAQNVGLSASDFESIKGVVTYSYMVCFFTLFIKRMTLIV